MWKIFRRKNNGLTKNIMKNNFRFVFFGTPELVVPILDELKSAEMAPALIVTAPDKRKGRGLILTPPLAKVWAEQNGIPVLQPEKLDPDFLYQLPTTNYQLFIVVAYGKILPQEIIDIPQYGTFNIHYSLLPKYRGATPVESAILNGDKETGVAIQKMVFKLDAGAIVAEEKVAIYDGETASALRTRLNDIAKKLLVETIKKIILGMASYREQNHEKATYCKKIKKEDGLIDLAGDPEENYRKYLAYCGWPGIYFFTEKKGKKIRVIIKKAEFTGGKFKIKRVLPEGGREIEYESFLQ
mgnify:FL=1